MSWEMFFKVGGIDSELETE